MRPAFTISLLSLFMLSATLWADDQLTAIPQPDHRITESTLIQGTGWSGTGNRNESLACDLAQSRAIHQIKKGIALSRSKGWITAEELSPALPLTCYRHWDPRAGRCTIRLELEVPSAPKSGIPIIHGRQF